jgi:outer membrane lipoprotein-sorting protein
VRRASAGAVAVAGAVAAVVVLAGAAGARAAAPPTADEVLARLAAAAQSTRTLAADFVQVSRVKLFKQELTSRGRLRFRAPRQLRWEYVEPDPSVLVLDGNRATLRAPGSAPRTFDLASDATMRAVFDQLLLWLAPDSLARVRTEYALRATGDAREAILVLTPRDGTPVARAFRDVQLRVDPSGVVRGITLTEKSGDEKTIRFEALVRNQPIADDTFR